MLTDEDLICLHATGRSVYALSKECGVPSTSLHRKFTALGLSVSHKSKIREDKVKDKADEVLRLATEGKDRGEIAHIIGCDRSTISRLLKRHGLGSSVRTWDYDESFFDSIDTQEKAYTLGLFTADGCNRSNTMSIRITDRDVVEQIAASMKYTGNIRTIQPYGKAKQVQHDLSICSTRLCTALTRLGCPPIKTFVTAFPTSDMVPDAMVPHYIRGEYDGDGSLYHTNNGWHMAFAGTEALLEPMFDHIRSATGIRVGGVYKHGNIKILKVPGAQNCIKVLDWLYADATIFMRRKHQLYLQMKG